MGEANNNQNNGTNGTGTEGNQNQQSTQQGNNSAGNTQQNNSGSENVNTEEIKKQAQAELLKKLGYDDESALSGDITAYKEYLDGQKTEAQKMQDTLDETTEQLAEEKEARILAEAKLDAVNMGVKPGLVNDVVLIAKSRVTKDKTITAVLTEMKANADEKIYFVDETEEEDKGGKNKGKNMTRNKPSESGSNHNNNAGANANNSGSEGGKHAGTMAARLLQGRRNNGKSYYFKDK